MHEYCVNLKEILRTSRPQGSLQIVFVITKLTSHFTSLFEYSVILPYYVYQQHHISSIILNALDISII